MSSAEEKEKVILGILHGEINVNEAADILGCTRQWIYKLRLRYEEDGIEGLKPRSRAPKYIPHRTSDEMVELIIQTRDWLDEEGYYSGARTIHWQLQEQGYEPPSVTTIHRILAKRRQEESEGYYE
ncbi:MAG: helix-turn-helix domain-containing protein [Corynebacterium sp.]|nr:helix-turn-helix domain-containing protein [Corynebacterium sp.]